MVNLKTLFNGLLVGASGYALYCMKPQDKPYAFTVCAFGICHGLLGLIESMKGGESDSCSKIKEISSSIMEMIPLPLINIELYLASSSSNLALGHGLFIIPLAFDLIAKLFTDEGEDSSTETLKDLTILGNVVSLTFLAVNENNYLYGGMALCAFLTKYGAGLSDSLYEGSGEYEVLIGDSVLIYLTTEAVAAK